MLHLSPSVPAAHLACSLPRLSRLPFSRLTFSRCLKAQDVRCKRRQQRRGGRKRIPSPGPKGPSQAGQAPSSLRQGDPLPYSPSKLCDAAGQHEMENFKKQKPNFSFKVILWVLRRLLNVKLSIKFCTCLDLQRPLSLAWQSSEKPTAVLNLTWVSSGSSAGSQCRLTFEIWRSSVKLCRAMGKYQGWEAPIPGCSNLNTQMPAQLRAAATRQRLGNTLQHPHKYWKGKTSYKNKPQQAVKFFVPTKSQDFHWGLWSVINTCLMIFTKQVQYMSEICIKQSRYCQPAFKQQLV